MSDAGSDASRHAVRLAARDEAETVAAIVREAFQTVADQIGLDIPPIHESADDVRASMDVGETLLVAHSADGSLVGTVRGGMLEDDSVMVRKLAVLPASRGQGIARALMVALEAAYPRARRFELFTGAGPEGAVGLYEQLGYRLMPTREDFGIPLVYMEKCR